MLYLHVQKKYVQTKETISVINKSFCLKKLNRNFLLDISTNIGSDEIKAKAGNQKPKFIQIPLHSNAPMSIERFIENVNVHTSIRIALT